MFCLGLGFSNKDLGVSASLGFYHSPSLIASMASSLADATLHGFWLVRQNCAKKVFSVPSWKRSLAVDGSELVARILMEAVLQAQMEIAPTWQHAQSHDKPRWPLQYPLQWVFRFVVVYWHCRSGQSLIKFLVKCYQTFYFFCLFYWPMFLTSILTRPAARSSSLCSASGNERKGLNSKDFASRPRVHFAQGNVHANH